MKVPKINDIVYIIVADAGAYGSVSVVKGRVSGCREYQTSFGKWLYTITTAGGDYERFALDMWETICELQDDIANLVVD